jgi:hypothetical protein
VTRDVYTLLVRALLSVLFLAGYGVVLVAVLRTGAEFSPSAEKLATFVLGALTTSIVSIVAYWFGSTQGSADKTTLMARDAPGP